MLNRRQEPEPLLCGVTDAGRALGVGRSTVYSLIDSGQLETVSIGRRRLIRLTSVKALAGGEAAA